MNDIWHTRYNPFNSMKVLLWRQHLEGMATGKLLPPITVDFDPTNLCNSNCIWCNSRYFREKSPQSMTTQHMLDLAEFLSKWGVKSACVAGGGESMLNPGTSEVLYKFNEVGMKTGVITNGIHMSEKQMDAILLNSDWCGFSIDAGDRESYRNVHRNDGFDKVISNLKKLIEKKKQLNSQTTITYKFLLHPKNAMGISSGAKLAKEIGCNMMQVRPVCLDNLYNQSRTEILDFRPIKNEILEQMEYANTLTDKDFKFFGVRHKFGDNFERQVNFKKCRAVSVMAVYCADGTVQMCHDLRGKDNWILCRHDNPEDILEVWGSKRHLDMIDTIDPYQCPRCTFGAYNEIIENVIIEDKMCRNFP